MTGKMTFKAKPKARESTVRKAINVMVTEAEHDRLKRQALSEGTSVSAMLRMAGLERCNDAAPELAPPPKPDPDSATRDLFSSAPLTIELVRAEYNRLTHVDGAGPQRRLLIDAIAAKTNVSRDRVAAFVATVLQ